MHLCVYQHQNLTLFNIFLQALCLSRSWAEGWAAILKVAVMDCSCVCKEYTVWPERRHRLQFHSSLCLPPRMKPYRIMSTLSLLLPQHRQLACHNTLTYAGREKESTGSVKATLSVFSRGRNSSHLQWRLRNSADYTMNITLFLNWVACTQNQSTSLSLVDSLHLFVWNLLSSLSPFFSPSASCSQSLSRVADRIKY